MVTLLVCLNAKYIHASPAPYALLSGIRKYGQAVREAIILEGTVNEEEEALLSRILSCSPDFIGFSCYIWNITLVLRLAQAIRRRGSSAIICLGGPEASSCAMELLSKEGAIDFVLCGEGEMSLPSLLDAVALSTDVGEISGLCYRRDGEIFCNSVKEMSENPPSPLSSGYAENLSGRIAYYETSRGCPFHCSFCLSGQGHGVCFYDLQRAIADLYTLARSGSKTIKLVDRTFNASKSRAKEIWRRLISDYGIHFPCDVIFHFEIEASLLDEESFLILANAPRGLFQFEVGLQSTNPETLSAIGRSEDAERVLSAVSRLVSMGNITVHLDLILGLPHETLSSFTLGFHRAFMTRPRMLQLGFLKLLHGTSLRRDAESFGISYSELPPYTVSQTASLSFEDIQRIKRLEIAFDRLYNSGRHRRTIEFLLSELSITPFDLFMQVGESLDACPAKGLDDLCERLLSLFAQEPGDFRERMIDVMLADRLATNPNRHLPRFLSRFDRRIAHLRAARKGSASKNFALLSNGKILEADVGDRDPVSCEFSLRIIDAF